MATVARRPDTYVGGCVIAAALGIVAVWTTSASWLTIGLLLVLFWLCGSLSTRAGSEIRVSTSFVVGMAAVLITGPFGAALVGIGEGVSYAPNGSTRLKRLFNAAQFSLAGLVSGLAADALAGHGRHAVTEHADETVWRLLLITAVVALAYYLVNITLVAGVVAVSEGLSLGRVWWGSFSWLSASYFAYGLLGLLMAVLWVRVSILAGVLVLVPLLIARWAFAQYAAEHEAYDATVRALIQAVETKDYYTRGHSERVSRATVLIAREWGLREDKVNVIRYAGLLHDVGKLGVPTKVLQKQGKLNDAEYDAIKLHPIRGYEMLREITFLEEAMTGVVHHHERMDGKGYPMGLVGTEIPEFARIIMVADAFDSMTSTRSYRSAKTVAEAVAELRKWQGVQFDEHAVNALVRALDKNPWEPSPEEYHGELVAKDGTLIERPKGELMRDADVPVDDVVGRQGLST